MTAIILNSGIGNRMGELTHDKHKAMVRLRNGETIFARQIRVLKDCGVKNFVVTTGAFEHQLIEQTKRCEFKGLNFTFVNNPVYDKTNYIYSLYLAKEQIKGEVLMLHGDLVFNCNFVRKILTSGVKNLGCVNIELPLPEKDFKAEVRDGRIVKVAIDIFGKDCHAFQPFYKLSENTFSLWMKKIEQYCNDGDVKVYAENALNEIAGDLDIAAFSYKDNYMEEIDTAEDLHRVSEAIRYYDYAEQTIITEGFSTEIILQYLKINGLSKPLFVCGENTGRLGLAQELKGTIADSQIFSGYSPNPKYEEVVQGAKLFADSGCDCIIAIGGGSAIDVSKCIKGYMSTDSKQTFINGEINYSPLKIIVIPTTAGTGSESTTFAVLYFDGEKKSIEHDSLLPDLVGLIPDFLTKLPDYQKKCTVMDAMSQCIESIWAMGATVQSQEYAVTGLKYILNNLDAYIAGDSTKNYGMLNAANLSGKAINISKTTAAHAMSYKLSSLYGISHGHAVILCLPHIMRFMESQQVNSDLQQRFSAICNIFSKSSLAEVATSIESIADKLGLNMPTIKVDADINLFVESVNLQRLGNNPVAINKPQMMELYTNILR